MMKFLSNALVCAMLSAAYLCAQDVKKPAEPAKPDAPKLELKTDKDVASYALGLSYGTVAREIAADVDVEAMAAGFRDAISGAESKLSDKETGVLNSQFEAFMKKKKAGDKTAALENKAGASGVFGRNMGLRVCHAGKSINADIAATGFATAAKGEPVAIAVGDHKTEIDKYFKTVQDDLIAVYKEALPKNEKEGEEFLAENKKKDGVITTPSGLQYKILVEGKGEIPKPSDKVELNFTGRLINGKIFDSTERHGEAFETDLVHLTAGWIEALKIMPVGSKWELYVPANLAYGENGKPPYIQGGSTLIFDMELLRVKK